MFTKRVNKTLHIYTLQCLCCHEIYIAFALHRIKFSAQTTREQIYFLLFTQIVENKRRKISSHFPPESSEFLVRKQENSQQKEKQILESHMHACRRRVVRSRLNPPELDDEKFIISIWLGKFLRTFLGVM